MTVRQYDDEPVAEQPEPSRLHDMGAMDFIKNEAGRVVGSVFQAEADVQVLTVRAA